MNTALITKYNVPGPRYTSYPTVPYWEQATFSANRWMDSVRQAFEESNEAQGVSVYVHLPYCENLCTFCGCNKRITRNHAVEEPYIDNLLREWSIYRESFGAAPRLREIHLGGGTPTFFTPRNLAALLDGLRSGSSPVADFELGFEANPNYTTRDHLETLYERGARRLSLGIQDFDPRVQEVINRIQPFSQVAEITSMAREIGYASINFDLVYGNTKGKKNKQKKAN